MLDQTDTHTVRAPRIYDDITQTIGHTPLVRLSRLQAELGWYTAPLAKLEYFNPAGSIKDRPAMAMMQALLANREHPQMEIIEASSGNNGVAVAWLGTLFDVPVTIVIPEHMSVERQHLIRHYGATVITTPKALGTKGAIEHAAELVGKRPHAVSLNQFSNQANVFAHAQTTAQEIWHDTQGEVDVIVAGVGTGGTLTGLAHALRKYNPELEVVAVEPASCPVLSEARTGVHNIQGLSSGHIPDILDIDCISQIQTVTDDEAILFARHLARVEGMAVGISAGAALAATTRLASQLTYSGKHIVTILADGAERYFSTDLFDKD